MITFKQILSEIKLSNSDNVTIYTNNNELYKIENFPVLGTSENPYNIVPEEEPEKYNKFLQNSEFKKIIKTIFKHMNLNTEEWNIYNVFREIEFFCDLNKPNQTIYAYTSGDGGLYFYDTLDDWRNVDEEDWVLL